METLHQKDIAIVGVACRVAGANSPSELWELLSTSRDVQSEITRFNINGYYHPDGASLKGLTDVKRAYMMDDDLVDRFDNAFFRISPQEAAAIDPQQRLLLEVAYEAVESAGIPLDQFMGSDTAVFAGVEGSDYHTVMARDIDVTPKYLATGTPTCMTANRISYFFNLSGASFTVDSACSSSMTALHQAVSSLQRGESKMAMICGAKLILNPDMFMPATEMGFLSPSGRCRTFDAAADGYGRGEGFVAFLLRPLEAALENNDPVRGIIKGTRLNHDGRTQGITLPSSTAQVDNMLSLYSTIGVTPNQIQYFEAHGTGTSAGDPIETSAINTVFNTRPREHNLVIGSIKSNIGHLEACSALAGILKTVLAFENRSIPAQMHFERPNPNIDFSQLVVPTVMTDWPYIHNEATLAAVNSFGAGGSNGHAVLQASDKQSRLRQSGKDKNATRRLLYKITANTDKALQQVKERLKAYIKSHEVNPQDLAYTLCSRRSTLAKTTFWTADSIPQLLKGMETIPMKIVSKPPGRLVPLVFVFTGQGAQWPGMGKELLQSPLFRSTVDKCQEILNSLPDKSCWSIEEELCKDRSCSNIYRSEFSQPLCTIVQLGLVDLLRFWSVKPNAVVGHSSGEIAAAYAAGMIDLRTAVIAAYYRGIYLSNLSRAVNNHTVKGSMCSIGLSELDARKFIQDYEDRVQLAAINSPSNCTLSGDDEAIVEIVQSSKETSLFCRQLKVDTAFHSDHVLPAAPKYVGALLSAKVSNTGHRTCKMFSSVTGHEVYVTDISPQYWADNMVQTVKFSPSLTRCFQTLGTSPALIEIGPHPALKAPVEETAHNTNCKVIGYFHTCFRDTHAFDSLLLSIGELAVTGVEVDLSRVNTLDELASQYSKGSKPLVLHDLPTYPWDHSVRHWEESDASKSVRQRRHRRHLLLGSRSMSDSTSFPSWRNFLRSEEVSFFRRKQENGLISEARYSLFVNMAIAAVRQMSMENAALSWEISNLEFGRSSSFFQWQCKEPMPLHFNAKLTESGPEKFEFDILSLIEDLTHEANGSIIMSRPDKNNIQGKRIDHEPVLLKAAHMHGWQVESVLQELEVSEVGATGSIAWDQSPTFQELEVIDAVLGLSLVLASLTVFSSDQNLRSIGEIFTLDDTSARQNTFQITNKRLAPTSVCCDIQINFPQESIVMKDVLWQSNSLRSEEPPLGCLISRPYALPDISYGIPLDSRTLVDVFSLVTHKWPMADAGIIASGEGTDELVCNLLRQRSASRLAFRSLQIQTDKKSTRYLHSKVHRLKRFEPNCSFHLFIVDGPHNGALEDYLRSDGILCLSSSLVPAAELGNLVKLGHLTDTNGKEWSTYRKRRYSDGVNEKNSVVFFSEGARASYLDNIFQNAKYVGLDPESLMRFCSQEHPERYTAIVVESNLRSVISTLKGEHMMPWLRNLMQHAQKIIWVTQADGVNPFHGLAGIVLRTLQVEQPSLRVSWIVVNGVDTASMISAKIQHTYQTLQGEMEEIKVAWNGDWPIITRYKPDDELGAMAGLFPPRTTENTLASDHYKLVQADKNTVLFDTGPGPTSSSNGMVVVNVQASVVDFADLSTVTGRFSPAEGHGFGFFFAGVVGDGHHEHFPHKSRVIGWTRGAHARTIHVSKRNLLNIEGDVDDTQAVAMLGALAVSLTAIDGAARMRTGDVATLSVHDQVLEGVLIQIVTYLGGSFGEKTSGTVDFEMKIDSIHGLTVNDNPVTLTAIERYLASDRGRKMLEQFWNTRSSYAAPFNVMSLTEANQALAVPLKDAFGTVLDHRDLNQPVTRVVRRHTRDVYFESESIYIVIGGLGGLGRFVCSWLVMKGVRRLVVLSRSGAQASQAQQAVETVEKLGASIDVRKVDACNKEAVTAVLTDVRRYGRIKGVFNMAMILADAPLSDMTGEQWDEALRLKIDSSWNLHEATLEDDLDFFILFSSIASVLGNRSQANYNVGNAFLNALAEYRHTLNLPAVSIALGAMTEIGVLHELGRQNLLEHLTRSGLTALNKYDLTKILEAAIIASPQRDRPVILTGLEMFERRNGKIIGRQDQTQLSWTERSELGHLQDHRVVLNGPGQTSDMKLRDQLRMPGASARDMLMDAFQGFLAQLQGFERSVFEPHAELANFGLDSLSSVSIQFWFHREAGIAVSVGDVSKAKTIADLVEVACDRLPTNA